MTFDELTNGTFKLYKSLLKIRASAHVIYETKTWNEKIPPELYYYINDLEAAANVFFKYITLNDIKNAFSFYKKTPEYKTFTHQDYDRRFNSLLRFTVKIQFKDNYKNIFDKIHIAIN